MTYEEFLQFEEKQKNSEGSIVINKLYIDITQDFIAGVLLSYIIHSTSRKSGEWIIKKRSDWYPEIRITARQYDRALALLKGKELVEVQIHKSKLYHGAPVPHIRVNYNKLILVYELINANKIIQE